jgi:[ribosomal protein S18]-alanine N-acetyltransferase
MFCMAADDIVYRLAGNRDVDTIARMSRDLIEHGLAWRYDAPKVARLVADPDTLALVAGVGHGLAGFAVMQFGAERAHLSLLAVWPRWQRQGVARRLLQWLFESARVAGISGISLELRAGNRPARAFYRTMGFAEAGQLASYYDNGETALRMLRTLRKPGFEVGRWQPPTLRRP